jgi:hypothetical protein
MKRLALVFLAACGSKTAPPAPIDNTPPPDDDVLLPDGDYLCWGGFHEYLCTVKGQQLAKVGGSDRYSGTLVPAEGGGFRLEGAREDGTQLVLDFAPQPDGSWRAEVPVEARYESDHYTIRYMGGLGSVFGSETYGGGYDEEEDE